MLSTRVLIHDDKSYKEHSPVCERACGDGLAQCTIILVADVALGAGAGSIY